MHESKNTTSFICHVASGFFLNQQTHVDKTEIVSKVSDAALRHLVFKECTYLLYIVLCLYYLYIWINSYNGTLLMLV